MQRPEERVIDILKKNGIDFACTLPCEKIKNLLDIVETDFFHVPLTREEEGVGISAGAALSGKRPAMFVQSSGIGNMINALLSLTVFYQLPLSIFISRRGVYKEKIEAQIPMGKRLPDILRGAGIAYTVINTKNDLKFIEKKLNDVYKKNRIHAFLMNPAVWETECRMQDKEYTPLNPPFLKGEFQDCSTQKYTHLLNRNLRDYPPLKKGGVGGFKPKFTRYEILNIISPYLNSKTVVCNLGFPSKELYNVKHQPSNFYMLGSMGMATPIGLGIALTSKKEVVVIDGDGSLLMNPGTLATAAYFSPENLTIFAIDNGTYGSTGDQPTLTGSCVDLEVVAKGFGIRNTIKVTNEREMKKVMKKDHGGLTFIHAAAIPGNKDLPPIPLSRLEIKKQVQNFLKQH